MVSTVWSPEDVGMLAEAPLAVLARARFLVEAALIRVFCR